MHRVLGTAAWCCSLLAVACLILGVVAAPVGAEDTASIPTNLPCYDSFCTSTCTYVGAFETCPDRRCAQNTPPPTCGGVLGCSCVLDRKDELLIRWYCKCT